MQNSRSDSLSTAGKLFRGLFTINLLYPVVLLIGLGVRALLRRVQQDILLRFYLQIFCVALLGLGVYAQVEVASRMVPRSPDSWTTAVPLERAFDIDIGDMVDVLGGLRADERPQQLADWAMLGTVQGGDLPVEVVREALYDRAPIRLPLFEEVHSFDYGKGRYVLLPENAAWMFVSANDPHPTSTLGRMADQVRIARGKVPGTVRVYRYGVDLAKGIIHVERQPDLTGEKLFTSEYGYHERTVANAADLVELLFAIDDVTYVRFEPVPTIGGRVLADRPAARMTLEDVSVLYKAQRELETDAARSPTEHLGFSLDPQWDKARLAADLELLQETPQALVVRARELVAESEQRRDPAAAKPREVWAAEAVVEQFVATPARELFTLTAEQSRQLAELLSISRHHLEQPQDVSLSTAFIKKIKYLKDGPASSSNQQLAALLTLIRARHEVQCARYDGNLKGTQVGMTLFYADLLAKLWISTDWNHSAPIEKVLGLVSKPINDKYVAARYRKEAFELSSTRIWFGPKDGAFLLDGNQLLFSPVATQVFAKGSNPLNADEGESAPSESSRQAVTWWDRHYEFLADYEPQYHRQNQIMKWSIVFSLLSRQANEALAVPRLRLDRLFDRDTDQSQVFDVWFQDKPNLRFKGDIRMLPRSRWINNTECMERLQTYPFRSHGDLLPSWVIEGGVSLSSRQAIKTAVQPGNKVPVGLWRNFLNYAESNAREVSTFKGTHFEVPMETGQLVKVTPAAKTRLRLNELELRSDSLSSKITNREFTVSDAKANTLASVRIQGHGRVVRLQRVKGMLQLTDRGVQFDPSLFEMDPSGGKGSLGTAFSESAQLKSVLTKAAKEGHLGAALDALQNLNEPAADVPAGVASQGVGAEGGGQAQIDVLEAQLGQIPDLTSKMAANVRVVHVGVRNLAAIKTQAVAQVVDKAPALADVKAGKSALYVATELLNQTPLSENSAGFLAQVEQNPALVVKSIPREGMGSFTPDLVENAGQQYVQIPASIEPIWRLRPTTVRPLLGAFSGQSPANIYLLTPCADRNGDGQVDSAEEQLCLCDSDEDGVLIERERAACRALAGGRPE